MLNGIARWLCGWLAVAVCGVAAVAQSGLPARPINLTCVAPAAAAVGFTLEKTIVSAETRGAAAASRDNGVLYRGIALPAFHQHYVYLQDNALKVDSRFGHGSATLDVDIALPEGSALTEGVDSELYIIDPQGQAWQLKQEPLTAGGAATLLSETGCFDPADPSIPAPGLIEYSPSAPLWSDNAAKRRWIAMPDWQTSGTQISILPDGDFDFPNGTVLVKEFRLGNTIVETRLFVRDLTGDWTGYSYEWNAEQTDATLLSTTKTITINGQEWTYPAPAECLVCHGAAANRSLGLETAQLNHAITYSATGISANQLTTLVSIGLIDPSIGDVSLLYALPFYDDVGAPVDERARGYLHSNCSNCHRPGGLGVGPMNFLYQLDGSAIGSNDVDPWRGNLGVPGAKILLRGAPELSVISLRMKALDFTRMPLIGSAIIDVQGTTLIDDWIESGLGFGIGDADGDNKADDLDNCSAVANSTQIDADGDGYGNACDPDLNNDNIVNFLDLALFSNVFLTNDAVADFNGDGVVNFVDLSILAGFIFMAPGPSGLNP
ncbi:MAG: dockerin type I domain-containing protein [Pseudomonadota bacterium]